ncbi:thiol:disulfide oxidoreductase [Marinobacterium nitratireducens]|uniref:Thiol:disulfide oxidoreductase n=1 Tax=Marinobacterium nitratireducens TaxID=518897 RepID=A0A917ZD78_9GAMM|nr:glutathione S-transferase N-terminal domain-containing protein [Marinobacterium nitratireducens]GGO79653.1 thiol:disulfide oxidoreductase [Marinobacterium nitratireducens]
MIELHTWSTPNGRKISIMLEAVRLPYRVIPVDITSGDQHRDEFLELSPNNKIPALRDPDGPDGEPIELFESGAILIYLAEKTGLFLPRAPRARYEVLQWLMWQMGNFGPFLGQAHHFNRFAKEEVPYAIERYQNEARRLWGVLDRRLEGRSFVADDLSIADFAIYPWCARFEYQEIDPGQYPRVHDYMQRMAHIEFVQRGMQVP